MLGILSLICIHVVATYWGSLAEISSIVSQMLTVSLLLKLDLLISHLLGGLSTKVEPRTAISAHMTTRIRDLLLQDLHLIMTRRCLL